MSRATPFAVAATTAGALVIVAGLVAADRALSKERSAAPATTSSSSMSHAGMAPPNAAELAKAHDPYPAALPPVPPGDLVRVRMVMKDKAVEVAPGVFYNVWAFDGALSAPGPIVHVREGQMVEMTLVNGGAIAHSIDFHAARIAPNIAFRDVQPGESFTFQFRASDPGVYMYHCGTKPVLAHIANGMYGAIVVSPAQPLPKADREYVLVASEWYLNGDGIDTPASLDLAKARRMEPDWTAFNGYANQYVTHPLVADPGDLVRFYVVDAGPSLTTAFHVVGTIFDTVYPNGDMNLAHVQNGVQTVDVPAGGGAVFEVQIDEPGFYPFVSHAFAHVDLGQVGLLKVGEPTDSATH